MTATRCGSATRSTSAPTNQVIMPGNVGFIPNYNPYPNRNGSGDPVKARALLAKAGYPNGLDVKLMYQTLDPYPRVAQSVQASLNRAGFRVKLVPATTADFYGKYMLVPSTAQRGLWDSRFPAGSPTGSATTAARSSSPSSRSRCRGRATTAGTRARSWTAPSTEP